MSLDVRQLSRAVLGPVYYSSHRFGRPHVEHAYDRKSGIWSMYSAGGDTVERNDLRSVYFSPRELRPQFLADDFLITIFRRTRAF